MKVMYVKNIEGLRLTDGKIYDVLHESQYYYKVKDDIGCIVGYLKQLFEIVEEPINDDNESTIGDVTKEVEEKDQIPQPTDTKNTYKLSEIIKMLEDGELVDGDMLIASIRTFEIKFNNSNRPYLVDEHTRGYELSELYNEEFKTIKQPREKEVTFHELLNNESILCRVENITSGFRASNDTLEKIQNKLENKEYVTFSDAIELLSDTLPSNILKQVFKDVKWFIPIEK